MEKSLGAKPFTYDAGEKVGQACGSGKGLTGKVGE